MVSPVTVLNAVARVSADNDVVSRVIYRHNACVGSNHAGRISERSRKPEGLFGAEAPCTGLAERIKGMFLGCRFVTLTPLSVVTREGFEHQLTVPVIS